MESTQVSALNSSVLILNRQYMAIHVVGVRRAFGLLLSQLAEVIHIEDGQYANYAQHHHDHYVRHAYAIHQ